MEKVIIEIRGGVASVVALPVNVEVILRDYDNEEEGGFVESVKLVDGEIIYVSGN